MAAMLGVVALAAESTKHSAAIGYQSMRGQVAADAIATIPSGYGSYPAGALTATVPTNGATPVLPPDKNTTVTTDACTPGYDYIVDQASSKIQPVKVCSGTAVVTGPPGDAVWGHGGAVSVSEPLRCNPDGSAASGYQCHAIYCGSGDVDSKTPNDYSKCESLKQRFNGKDAFNYNKLLGVTVAQDAIDNGCKDATCLKASLQAYGIPSGPLDSDIQSGINDAFKQQSLATQQNVTDAQSDVNTLKELSNVYGCGGNGSNTDACDQLQTQLPEAQQRLADAQEQQDQLKSLAAATKSLSPNDSSCTPGTDGCGPDGKPVDKATSDLNKKIDALDQKIDQQNAANAGRQQSTFPSTQQPTPQQSAQAAQQAAQQQCQSQQSSYTCTGTAIYNMSSYWNGSQCQQQQQLMQQCPQNYLCQQGASSCVPNQQLQQQMQCQSVSQTPPSASLCSVGSWQGFDPNGNIVYNGASQTQQYQTYSGTTQSSCIASWRCVPNSSQNCTTVSGVTTCNGANGTQPTASFTQCPQAADANSTIQLNFTCANATQSQGTNFDTGGAVQGPVSATIPALQQGSNTSNVTYTLACINTMGQSAGAQCTVKYAKASIVFISNPSKVAAGKTATLGWLTTTKSCVITDNDFPDFTAQNANNTSPNGTVTTPPLTQETKFTLKCQTWGGQEKDQTIDIQVI